MKYFGNQISVYLKKNSLREGRHIYIASEGNVIKTQVGGK